MKTGRDHRLEERVENLLGMGCRVLDAEAVGVEDRKWTDGMETGDGTRPTPRMETDASSSPVKVQAEMRETVISPVVPI